MVELPPEIESDSRDRAEAEAVVARIGGADSVVTALAADLADGIAGRDLVVTASGDLGSLAARYWSATIRSAGVVVYDAGDVAAPGSAQIHLHAGSGDVESVVADSAGADLIGQVVSQGTSPAARYSSLATVAQAVAAALRHIP